jgi:hypothetical protein
MNHRSTASFGKRQEYIAVAELLRRGFDVYMTLVAQTSAPVPPESPCARKMIRQ